MATLYIEICTSKNEYMYSENDKIDRFYICRLQFGDWSNVMWGRNIIIGQFLHLLVSNGERSLSIIFTKKPVL